MYCSTKLCHIKMLGFYVPIKNVAMGKKSEHGKIYQERKISTENIVTMISFFSSHKEKVTRYNPERGETFSFCFSLHCLTLLQ